jgi:hypothetical protein
MRGRGVGPELASLPPQIVLFFRKRNLKVYSYLLCTENDFIPTKTSFWVALGDRQRAGEGPYGAETDEIDNNRLCFVKKSVCFLPFCAKIQQIPVDPAGP